MRGRSDKASDVRRTIDKLEKVGPDKVREILTEDCGATSEQADEILKFITIEGATQGILEALKGYEGKNETLDQGISELTTVATYMEGFGVPADHFEIDLTIARGLDYYTGTVYETTMLDHPEIGSICSGGRYDNLAEYYTDKKLPGVGISIGLTRLFFVLQDKDYLNQNPPASPADVMILPMTDEVDPAIELATRLRDNGIRVQLHCEKKKFKAKITYADKLAIPYVIFMGEDEIKNNVVALKELATGEQTNTGFDEALVRIRDGLAARAAGTVILDR